jgi:protein-S-isoprenylcysteine O-methyltransferase Ste14
MKSDTVGGVASSPLRARRESWRTRFDAALQHERRLVARTLAFAFLALLLVSESRSGPDSAWAQALFPVGLLLASLGFAGRLWAVAYHAGHKNETLLTEGPYSVCRNPMYLSNLLGGIGVCVTTGTWTAPLLFLAVFAGLYPFVVRHEERNLRRRHGAAFDAYCRSTPALLPAFQRLREPEEYPVRLRLWRTHLLGCAWPLLAIAWIVLVQSLHAHGLLPVWVHIA